MQAKPARYFQWKGSLQVQNSKCGKNDQANNFLHNLQLETVPAGHVASPVGRYGKAIFKKSDAPN